MIDNRYPSCSCRDCMPCIGDNSQLHAYISIYIYIDMVHIYIYIYNIAADLLPPIDPDRIYSKYCPKAHTVTWLYKKNGSQRSIFRVYFASYSLILCPSLSFSFSLRTPRDICYCISEDISEERGTTEADFAKMRDTHGRVISRRARSREQPLREVVSRVENIDRASHPLER